MSKIMKDEVIKIAAMSHIELSKDTIDDFVQRLEKVLNYAERVKEIAADSNEPLHKRVNVFREDSVERCDAQRVLQEAPQREQDYFVVPNILDNAR